MVMGMRPGGQLEVLVGPPQIKPRVYIQMAIRGPSGGLARHQAIVLDARTDGVEIQTVSPDAVPEVRAGAAVRCSLRRDDDALIWSAVVLEVIGPGPGHFLISHPDHHHRAQARHFVRIEMSLPVVFRVVDSGYGPAGRPGTGFTRDLGGGGLSLVTTAHLQPGRVLCLTLQLDVQSNVVAECRVVREIHPPRRGLPGCYGLVFSSISGSARDLIVRRVFQEQARRKRHGVPAKGGRS
jgi:hypothetical protein